MEEKEEVRKKLIRLTLYNVIGFVVIFAVFGIFVFATVRSITYNRINRELEEGKNRILQNENNNFNIVFEEKNWDIIKKDSFAREFIKDIEDIENIGGTNITGKIINPNITIVIRDLDSGEIINEGGLGRINEYASEISFNEKLLNKIYEISVGDKFYYRCINFMYGNKNSNGKYIQLMINIDTEKELIRNYFALITSAVCIGIILSIIVSYVLSKKTLKPLQDNLVKQTEFVQNVSHELRTPLTIIQAKQELLLQEPNAKIIDKSEDIMVTLTETNRLTKMIKDLMILSRADGNKMVLKKESVNIDDYIKEVISPYKDLAEMQNKNIVLNLAYNSDIEIDTSRFYQLLVILFDNAMKYTEENDTIEIDTYLKDNKFNLDVKDTGIGISDEGLKRIFERFYREDKARNRETGGSGLGLSIASLIVSAHGGTIKASHNNPKGTIFTIKLPK